MKLDVVGHRGRGRPKKTWADCIKNDRKVWKLSTTNLSDRESWKKALRKLSTFTIYSEKTSIFVQKQNGECRERSLKGVTCFTVDLTIYFILTLTHAIEVIQFFCFLHD